MFAYMLVDAPCMFLVPYMRHLGTLELELSVVLSTVWVLGTETRFSTRAVGALNYWTIFPSPSKLEFRKEQPQGAEKSQ